MENNVMQSEILKWLLKNSTNKIKWNSEYVEKIIDYIDKYITSEEKENYNLWLEYFLFMNLHETRIKYILDLIDIEFLSKKIELIDTNKYSLFIFDVLIDAIKKEVFEKNIEFNEENFYLGVDKLKIELKEIINLLINEPKKV